MTHECRYIKRRQKGDGLYYKWSKWMHCIWHNSSPTYFISHKECKCLNTASAVVHKISLENEDRYILSKWTNFENHNHDADYGAVIAEENYQRDEFKAWGKKDKVSEIVNVFKGWSVYLLLTAMYITVLPKISMHYNQCCTTHFLIPFHLIFM